MYSIKFRKLLVSAFIATLLASCATAQTRNGFSLDDTSIPANLIRGGGPPRDGIPSIDAPVFQSAESASWLAPDNRILGISIRGHHRAYPIAILNWHEVVNDIIDGQNIAITYCPLCGTGMVFKSSVENTDLEFGVSGLLYESDVLLYDRQTESLWSQLMSKAISGPYKGSQLEFLPVTHTNWSDWRQQYPDTLVLSRDTGTIRDYRQDPYIGYDSSPATMFPVVNKAPGPWHAKEWVLGVSMGSEHKAYPFAELQSQGKPQFQDQIAGESITIIWDKANRVASVMRNNEILPSITSFWFAWFAFHPDTGIFKAE